MGYGEFRILYMLDSANCNLDLVIDGIQVSLSSGNVTYTQNLSTGNHTISLHSNENSLTSPYGCREETLAIWELSLPRNRNATDNGLFTDLDDDNDGYSDYDETSGVCGLLSDPKDLYSIPSDIDGDLICDLLDTDIDGDGTDNEVDAFPYDSAAETDTDGDGKPDTLSGTSATGLIEDNDDDEDGTLDDNDKWPLDECVSSDHDSDGLADNVTLGCETSIQQDGDDDNDGKLDQDDFCHSANSIG